MKIIEAFAVNVLFPDGDPNGFRFAEIPNKPIQAFFIPRERVKQIVEQRPELKWNGVYMLFNQLKRIDHATMVYVGEAENVGNRLNQHNVNKENWWELAVAFVVNSEQHQLSKADIKYLENLMFKQVVKAGVMKVKNNNTPHQSFVNEIRSYGLKAVFENIDLLMKSLGFQLFDSAALAPSAELEEPSMVYFTGRQSDARAVYTGDALVVQQGSRLTPLTASKTFSAEKTLKELEQRGIISNNEFMQDYAFNSPSGAGTIIYKARCNGWDMWHDKSGKTMNELYR